jgi:hypothetical protein
VKRETALIGMELAEARRVKWARGRRKFGAEFVGDPLEEAFEEVVDLLNYLDELAVRGEEVEDLPRVAAGIGARLQDMHLQREGSELPRGWIRFQGQPNYFRADDEYSVRLAADGKRWELWGRGLEGQSLECRFISRLAAMQAADIMKPYRRMAAAGGGR